MCTDLEGNLLWLDRDLPYEGIHGVGSSLVADNGCVFVTSLNAKAPYITALDCSSGKRIWTANLNSWRGLHGEYRTPLIMSIQDRKALVNWFGTNNELAAYDVCSGEELWKCRPAGTFVGEAVASILTSDNTVYLPNRSDFVAMSIPGVTNTALPTTLWKTNMQRKGPITASPVLSKGMLFMVSDSGFASCLSATNGELLWQKRLPRGRYLASPLVMGNHVYFWSTAGITTVVACDRKFTKVAENILPGGIYASPAPAEGKLIIRTTDELWCIE